MSKSYEEVEELAAIAMGLIIGNAAQCGMPKDAESAAELARQAFISAEAIRAVKRERYGVPARFD